MVLQVYKILCNDNTFSDVQHDVKLPGPDGERQIDVLVTHEHANSKYLTVIECRDFKGKLTVTHVDAFSSKLKDVRASKGIMVSRNGFSKTAIQKAQRLGIELCMVDCADKVLKNRIKEIQIVISFIQKIELNSQVFLGNKTDKSILLDRKNFTTINDKPLRELLIEELRTGQHPIPSKSCEVNWEPSELQSPLYIRDANGNQLPIEWLKVTVKISIEFYMGRASDFPDFIAHTQYGDKSVRVFVPPKFNIGFNSSLTRFLDKNDIPTDFKTLPCIVMPESDDATLEESRAWLFTPSGRRLG